MKGPRALGARRCTPAVRRLQPRRTLQRGHSRLIEVHAAMQSRQKAWQHSSTIALSRVSDRPAGHAAGRRRGMASGAGRSTAGTECAAARRGAARRGGAVRLSVRRRRPARAARTDGALQQRLVFGLLPVAARRRGAHWGALTPATARSGQLCRPLHAQTDHWARRDPLGGFKPAAQAGGGTGAARAVDAPRALSGPAPPRPTAPSPAPHGWPRAALQERKRSRAARMHAASHPA
jgi:hypothetical protein